MKVSIPDVSARRAGVALAAVLVAAVGGLSYWFRASLADFFSSAWDGVLTTLGLGIIPVVLWLAVFAWALKARRSWFARANLWLGSVALMVLTLGILGFFKPSDGVLSEFTLDGDVSLGGDVGRAIIGSASWLGVLRLLGILIAGVAVTSPPLAADLAMVFGRLAMHAYVFLVVAARGVVVAARGVVVATRGVAVATRGVAVATRGVAQMYRFKEGKASTAYNQGEPHMPPEVLSPYVRTRTVRDTGSRAPGNNYPRRPGSDPAILSAPPSPMLKSGELDSGHEWAEAPEQQADNGLFDDAGELTPDHQEGDSHLAATGKYNRFWSSSPEPVPQVQAEVETEDHGGPLAPERAAEAREWSRPSRDLLQHVPEGGITEEEMRDTAETIKRTLNEYKVEVEIGQVKPGPVVTMYGLIPGWVRRYKQVKVTDESGRPKLDEFGRPVITQAESKTRVKVDSILSREKDLALVLKTPSIRIETPVMGKSLVGIEVPNPDPSLVTLRSVMESAEFTRLRPKAELPVALGKGSGGETVVTDLAKMPHLLIAGATGSGKSVCINTIVSCLIMEKTPAEMRLLLIDPKRVELTPYNGVPHLLTPVVVETDQVVGLLKGTIHEMLDRYRRMEEVAVRNIEAYNEKMPDKMPFLVVAVDELADLMMSAAFDVEQSLCRLAQLGRATGIHLIIATQRPSVDVVTGLIKANFPSRLSFGVTSQVDSRTILDSVGAEKLLGRGDMLYLPIDASRPMRAQGVFISDREIESLVNFWQSTPWAPIPRVHLRAVRNNQGGQEDFGTDDDSRDELLDKAVELAHSYNKLSTSLLQRRLRIGYPRAARLMDQLEEQHIVGPSDGSKSRDVIINKV